MPAATSPAAPSLCIKGEKLAASDRVPMRAKIGRISLHLAQIEIALLEGDNAWTIEDFEMANREFHRALVAPCAMPRLLSSLDGLQLANSRSVFAMVRSSGWRPRPNQDHRLILQALRARNVNHACNLLARHIQAIERLVLPAS